ncbi:MAG: M14 family zinc carboxypeptidase [Chloroflexota bacterium]
MPAQELLAQAVQAARSGDKRLAGQLLARLLRQEPDNAQAWLWMAACVSGRARKRRCLKQALAIQPDHPQARRALQRLSSQPRRTSREASKARPGSTWQYGYMTLLALVVLALLAEMLWIVARDPLYTWQVIPALAQQADAPSPTSTISEVAPVQAVPSDAPTRRPTESMPVTPSEMVTTTATHTPTPTLSPSATATRHYPTPLPTQTASPVPSLTPISGSNVTIGYSVAGRPLTVYSFGNGRTERMIVAGIHGGNEWNTISLAEELMAHLRRNPDLVPKEVILYILPVLNPDGWARSLTADGRVNDHGVDLNRNFDANWMAEWPRRGCWSLRPTTSGPYPASEPETQALMAFLLSRRISALISYHSAAPSIYPSGDPPDPQSVSFAKAIAASSGYPYPPYDTGCLYSGTLVDWAARLGMAAVDLELTDHIHTDFARNLRVLQVLFTWQP